MDVIFNSIKEINRLRKEILSKGMSNIYLKVTIEKNYVLKIRFLMFKNLFTRSVLEELQLTQTSLDFKTSCCNLKIKVEIENRNRKWKIPHTVLERRTLCISSRFTRFTN